MGFPALPFDHGLRHARRGHEEHERLLELSGADQMLDPRRHLRVVVIAHLIDRIGRLIGFARPVIGSPAAAASKPRMAPDE